MSNEKYKKIYGKKAKERAKFFTKEKLVNSWNELLESI